MERRKYKREKKFIQVIHKIMGAKGEGKAVTIDVGGGGVRVPVSQKLPTGTLIELGIVLPGEEYPVYSLAKVAWQAEQPITNDKRFSGKYDTGIMFVKMSVPSRKKMVRFVHSKLEKNS